MTKKRKNVALEKVLEQTTLKLCDFWAGEALEAWKQDCLNITLAHKWHSAIFQIFRHDKKAPAHFYEIFGVVICKNHVARPLHSFNKCRNSLYQAWKLFSAEIWKMSEFHFWANVMLRQSRLRASRAYPTQKLQGLRVVGFKDFSRATFCVSWVT